MNGFIGNIAIGVDFGSQSSVYCLAEQTGMGNNEIAYSRRSKVSTTSTQARGTFPQGYI
jgi:hypothetical protein